MKVAWAGLQITLHLAPPGLPPTGWPQWLASTSPPGSLPTGLANGRHQQEMEGWWNKDHGALICHRCLAAKPSIGSGGHSSCQRPPCTAASAQLSLGSVTTAPTYPFGPKGATNSSLLLISQVFLSFLDFPSSLITNFSVFPLS